MFFLCFGQGSTHALLQLLRLPDLALTVGGAGDSGTAREHSQV